SLSARRSSKEHYKELAWINSLPVREWVSANHIAHFRRAAENHSRTKAELFLDPILNAPGQPCQVALFTLKDHIAALHVGLWLAQFKRLVEDPQLLHPNHVVAANIDPTEHGNNSVHKIKVASSCRDRRNQSLSKLSLQ